MLTLIAAFLGWLFDGMEMGIFPLVARPALMEMQGAGVVRDGGLVHAITLDERFVQHWMGIVTALFLIGAACGGFLFGWLGDRIGRVKAMTWSILCYSGFTGLCYFASEPWHLGALRLLAALGMGGEWALGVALVMETWPEARRPLMAGLIGAATPGSGGGTTSVPSGPAGTVSSAALSRQGGQRFCGASAASAAPQEGHVRTAFTSGKTSVFIPAPEGKPDEGYKET
jgi:MFS family permease